MDTQLLRNIGLTDSEIKVYLALLELGSTTKGPIVKLSKVASSKVYELLDKLINKGLASSVIKAGTKYFEAAPPERLMDYMKEKEISIQKQKQELKKVIPELELKQTLSRYKSEATIYRGIKGMETAFYSALNILKPKDEMLVIGIPKRSDAINRFFVKFGKERAKKNIVMKAIFNQDAKDDLQAKPENNPNAEIKFIPETTPAAINIFNDRVIIFPESEDILLIQIDSKEVAESFRVQFNKWWEQDITVTKGWDALKKVFYDVIDKAKRGQDTYDIMGATFGPKDAQKEYYEFFKNLHNYRKQQGVLSRLIFFQGSSSMVNKHRKELYDATGAEVKVLPYNAESPVQMFTAKDKAYLTIQEKEPTVITIDNQKVANAFKDQFKAFWTQDTRVVKGLDAIQNLFEEMLEAGHVDYIGARGYFVEARPRFIEEWEKRAIKKGFTLRNITDVATKGHKITQFPFAQTKYTMQQEFSKLSVVWIFGNKVAISNWTEKEPIAFIIENKKLYDMYKEQFNLLWNQDINTYTTMKGAEESFEDILRTLKSGDEYYVLGISRFTKHFEKFVVDFHKKRAKNGIRCRIIVNELAKDIGKQLEPIALTKVKYLKKELFTPVVFIIYKDKTLISIGLDEIFIQIKSENLTQGLKAYADYMWKIAA